MPRFRQETFKGGIADGSKVGYENSYDDGIGIDYRSDHDKTTSLEKLTKDSGNTVTDLIKWMLEYKGDFYFYGDTGKIYKRTGAGTWTNPKTVSSSVGQGFAIFNDEMWYANDDGIGKTSGLSSSPTFTDDYFKSVDTDKDLSSSTGGSTYAVPTSISETSANKKTFVPTTNYVSRISVEVGTKGAGSLTVTVHNSSDVVIATQTIANADFSASGTVIFDFDGGFTVTSGQTYHFHVISSAASTTIVSSSSNDLSTVKYVVAKSLNDYDTDLSNPVTLVSVTSSQLVTLSSSISESSRIEFVPSKQSLSAISFKVQDSNTGDITLTIHDANNTVVGSVTKTSSTFTGSYDGYYRFEFTTPLQLIVGATYHMHMTSSTSAARLQSSDTAFENIYYLTHFAILETDSNYHTMKEFANLLCIGNGRFLATIDDSEIYNPERLKFPEGTKIRCLEVIGDYLAISVWRGSSIADYGESQLYFWNGTSLFYTSLINIDGQINAIKNDGNNKLYIIHGTQGNLSVYTGGITPLKKIKGIGKNKTVEVYPQAIGSWEGLLRFGISDGTSTEVNRVIWSYGRKDKDFPYSLSKDYPISEGVYDNTVQIGSILGVSATKFFVSWKRSSTYGVDIIDTTSKQATTFVVTLREDGKEPNLKKKSKSVSIRHEPLTSGQSIKVYYEKNNSGSFTELQSASSTVGSIYKSFPFEERWFEVQLKVELIASSGVAPTLLSIEMEYEIDGKSKAGTLTET